MFQYVLYDQFKTMSYGDPWWTLDVNEYGINCQIFKMCKIPFSCLTSNDIVSKCLCDYKLWFLETNLMFSMKFHIKFDLDNPHLKLYVSSLKLTI